MSVCLSVCLYIYLVSFSPLEASFDQLWLMDNFGDMGQGSKQFYIIKAQLTQKQTSLQHTHNTQIHNSQIIFRKFASFFYNFRLEGYQNLKWRVTSGSNMDNA